MLDDIKKACEIMRSGGIILYPTDTIWGLGCDATNEIAVQKIYSLKKRVDSKAMLVLLDHPAKIQTYVDVMPDIAWDLIELSEKPLTIIYNKARNFAPSLTAEDGSIGIRITKEAFSRRLCEYFRKPVVSTSANRSGEKAPANFREISAEIVHEVDYVVSYRQDDVFQSKPSSIIKLDENGAVKIIRE